ncbi:hypothetical protein [Salipiger abyssi]|uniref:hypothetical protein n=1 Tax=Salipiger abyssi TaxID=1250539 RepID=UPI0040599E15
MSRSWEDLPRAWIMADLATARAADMKAYVREAVEWGFDQPEGLTNNDHRRRWLRKCRGMAWDMVQAGGEVPGPGKAQPAGERSKRAPARPVRPKEPVFRAEPAVELEGAPAASDFYPGRPRQTPRGHARCGAADLCDLPAREVNAWLRSLPSREEGGR